MVVFFGDVKDCFFFERDERFFLFFFCEDKLRLFKEHFFLSALQEPMLVPAVSFVTSSAGNKHC